MHINLSCVNLVSQSLQGIQERTALFHPLSPFHPSEKWIPSGKKRYFRLHLPQILLWDIWMLSISTSFAQVTCWVLFFLLRRIRWGFLERNTHCGCSASTRVANTLPGTAFSPASSSFVPSLWQLGARPRAGGWGIPVTTSLGFVSIGPSVSMLPRRAVLEFVVDTQC